MKPVLLTLALPVILLTGCASGGYYGYDNGPGYYPGYAGDYYDGGPAVDVGFYGGGHGDYYHRDYYHHNDHGYGYRSAVASRGGAVGFHAGGRSFASAGRSSGHFSGGHTGSASASAGHAGSGGGHR